MKKLFLVLFVFLTTLLVAQDKWKVDYFVDDFGDKTDKKFISYFFTDGKFSNSATSNSELCGYILYTNDGFYFRLFSYCRGPEEKLDDIYTSFKIKNAAGELLPFGIDNYKFNETIYYGYLHNGLTYDKTEQKNSDTVRDALTLYLKAEPNYLSFYVEGGDKYSRSKYLFKVPTKGFAELYDKEFGK